MSSPALSLRSPMMPGARRIRAYFAPVARDTSTPAGFDLARYGPFVLDSPPPGWVDAGWIQNFTRSAETRTNAVRSGPKAAPIAQFRAQLGARVEFDFRQWGKLQMALAGGSQHMNLLALDLDSDPTGQSPLAPVPLLAGSSATQLVIVPGALPKFPAGALVAVDLDYSNQLGYVGSGIAGAYVQSAAAVHFDQHYSRRVTFNVARVASQTSTALVLASPLLGGNPPANASVQKILGFTDREGGSFFHEWSAIFVVPDELGGRVVFHYPRLQPAAPAAEKHVEIAPPLYAVTLHAAFTALPITDARDSEQVVCYRAYFPTSSAAVY